MSFLSQRRGPHSQHSCTSGHSTDSSGDESSPSKISYYVDFDGKVIKTIPEKHKTELCKAFSEVGYCRYEEKCRFAHGFCELKQVSVGKGEYRHKKCRGFWESQECRYGTRCQFGHSEPLDWVSRLVLVVGQCYSNPNRKGESRLLRLLGGSDE